MVDGRPGGGVAARSDGVAARPDGVAARSDGVAARSDGVAARSDGVAAPLLARLAPDQRAAATAPPGPVLCVAPAGSGKTTTLIARICWLIDGGARPDEICALTFNRRAADELRARLGTALGPPDRGTPGEGAAERVRIRTFHALGLEILREAGQPIVPLLDRDEVLATVVPRASLAERRRLDTLISRFKLDLDVDPADIEADPGAGPVARTYAAYEREVERRGGLDFDDLVARALRLLEQRPDILARWRLRCGQLLVDEAQDLDRSQLRLALLLAAPANRIFLVGDDDQSIYGWRLADVRRLLSLAETSLPGLRRVDLVTNYRCPGPVVERAVRLVEHNRERFAKTIVARGDAAGSLTLAPSNADDVDRIEAVMRTWPADDGSTRAVLARTNRELIPAAVAAIRLGIPFAAPELELPVEAPAVDAALERAHTAALERAHTATPERLASLLARLAAVAPDRETGANLLSWAAAFPDLDALGAAIAETRAALAHLRRDDAALTLATAHGTKGLEFDHVAVVGLEPDRFPSARSVAEAPEPERALEEERRLAYVAWTRARRNLTLVYDPGAPSPFLLEAFSSAELGADPGAELGAEPDADPGADVVRPPPSRPSGAGRPAAAARRSVVPSARCPASRRSAPAAKAGPPSRWS
jgi:superfamily I DNA/RNA helicase